MVFRNCSLLAPEFITRRGEPTALQTSASLLMASTKAFEEKGRTMPDVPIMEMPSTIPSLGLNVRFASSRPERIWLHQGRRHIGQTVHL